MRYESQKFKDLTIRNFNAITELLLITILFVVVVGDYSSETTKININFIVPKKKNQLMKLITVVKESIKSAQVKCTQFTS